ncbi:MAG: stage II sporulation protein E [Clostridiaceae bacterium]|jgi:stage II sporulation protein E|nr:stage II sporulation protein E [Clostridiaceae bacterium]
MKTQAIPYPKLGDVGKVYERTKEGLMLDVSISKSNAIILLISFMLGRISLFQGFMPFGIAFFIAASSTRISRILMGLAVSIGMITGGGFEQVYITVTSIVIFSALEMLFANTKSKNNGLKIPIIAFVSVSIPQMVMVFFQGFLLYDTLKSICYSGLVFALVFIFKNSISIIEGTKKRNVFSNEEMISIAMLMTLTLAGIGNVQLAGMNLINVMGILAILLFSMSAGPGVGAAVGVIVGLVVNMTNPGVPMVIASYAFCGLLCGVFKSLGKVGACLGFIAANALLTLYLNGSTEILIYIKDILAAVLIVLFIPKKIMTNTLEYFTASTVGTRDKQGYSTRIKELTIDRLNKFSKAFGELSKTFSEISQTSTATSKQDITSLFDRVADKVCKDCSLCMHCWDRNFYNTYQVMFKIVEKLDDKGYINEEDIPDYFMDRCERISDFVRQVNNVYELFKVNLVWKNRVGESRGLMSQQLDGLSRVIANLANEIDYDVKFKGDLEDRLLVELDKAGIKANDAVIFQNKWGKNEVTIFHKGCGGIRNCINNIEKVATGVIGRKMIKESNECVQNHKTGICTLKLVEEETFRVTTGVARLGKYESSVSGDNYTFMNTGDGKYIVALSDGMGSGQKADCQSRAAISLLEQFMETGFDKDTAIKLINSILVLKSDDDSFATIDLSAIDLYDGKVEFVKIGAVSTYIKRPDRVETVKTVSLPAGILSDIETEMICKNVSNGDFIIMVSDGIIDSFKSEEGGEKSLVNYIEEIENVNPQGIADIILNKAYSNSGNKAIDDMTVLVAKVWKKVG